MPEAHFLPLLVLLQRVVTVTEIPRCYLATTVLAPRLGVGGILQDPDLISPLLPVEVRAQAILRSGGSRASREWAMQSFRCPRKSHVVYLGLVYCLDERNPTAVNLGLSPVHLVAVCCHGSFSKLQSTLRTLYPPSESHLVILSHPRALQRHGLLQHPYS